MPSDARDAYYEGQAFSLTTPTKKCCTFEGWYEAPDFSGAPVDKILSGDTGNRKFYAKWKVDPAKANLPKTGDSSAPLEWAALLAVTAGCAVALKKKRK